MPSYYRDPAAPVANRPLKVGVCAKLRDLSLTPAHRPIRDAYLDFAGSFVVA